MTEIDKDVPKHVYNRRALQYAFARHNVDGRIYSVVGAHDEWLWLKIHPQQEPQTRRAADYTLLTAFEVRGLSI